MRRVNTLALSLLLVFALAVPALAGFDADAFRQNFVAGLSGRANHPDLAPENVVVEASEKAADFAGTEIYAVKGRLEPANGQAQPFLLFVSADGRYFLPDLVDLSSGKSVVRDARDRLRSGDLAGYGHVIVKGTGKAVVVYVSDPFCPFCRSGFTYLMGKTADVSEVRLAHYPLASHSGADIACAIMDWARENAPARHLDFVRFAYTELPAPHLADRSPANLKKAWLDVAGAFLKKFPELKVLGKDAAAVVVALEASGHAKAVQADMARAAGMDVRGTPVFFVDGVRVDGFDKARLDTLLQ
jgi:protein-disulfide isomerase